MSIKVSRQATDHNDPQLPTMIGARLAAVSVGLLLTLTGGVLAASPTVVDTATLTATTHQPA